MLPQNIIYITILISLAGYFFYFKDIFYGETRPNLISWFLWMLAPFIGAFFQIKAGVGLSVIPIFMAGFGPLLVIVVSLFRKNSIWKITRLDLFCGFLALLALVFYVFTHNLGISILFAILSDGLAFIPTYLKAWKFPETETATIYFASIFNNTLALLIIRNWIFAIYSFNAYLIIANIFLVIILYRKKIFNFG
jgi:hypothetical protein